MLARFVGRDALSPPPAVAAEARGSCCCRRASGLSSYSEPWQGTGRRSEDDVVEGAVEAAVECELVDSLDAAVFVDATDSREVALFRSI